MSRPPAPRRRERIDLLLVERGLVPSRRIAQAAVLAGRVCSAGERIDKPGSLVDRASEIEVSSPPRFVGRAGEKLDGAIETLGLSIDGASVLDVGASTGGFTDCLLQRGASRVVALDVGHGQLDWGLRNDPRVLVIEGVNARWLEAEAVPGPFDLVTVDVSFISLRLVLPSLFPLVRRLEEGRRPPPVSGAAGVGPGGSPAGPASLPGLLALVKPQFEVGRGEVGKGGIVRDPEKQLAAILAVARGTPAPGAPPASEGPGSLAQLGVVRVLPSPLPGTEGNREFFLYYTRGAGLAPEALEGAARAAVAEAP